MLSSEQDFGKKFLDSKHVLKVYLKPSRKNQKKNIFTTLLCAGLTQNPPLKLVNLRADMHRHLRGRNENKTKAWRVQGHYLEIIHSLDLDDIVIVILIQV